MPFWWRGNLYFNALAGPTHDTSQNPVHDANSENGLFLSVREISQENVQQRDRSANDAHTKPPDNPAVNPNVYVVHKSRPPVI
jgi:hypothetical protein